MIWLMAYQLGIEKELKVEEEEYEGKKEAREERGVVVKSEAESKGKRMFFGSGKCLEISPWWRLTPHIPLGRNRADFNSKRAWRLEVADIHSP